MNESTIREDNYLAAVDDDAFLRLIVAAANSRRADRAYPVQIDESGANLMCFGDNSQVTVYARWTDAAQRQFSRLVLILKLREIAYELRPCPDAEAPRERRLRFVVPA